MTISAPPRPPEPVEALPEHVEPSALQEEALIEEARQRARRRRRRYGACVVLVSVAAALVWLAVGRDSGANGSASDPHDGPRAGTTSRLPRNGMLTIVSTKPVDDTTGGLYEVGKDGLGASVFVCGESTPCWELEGAAWAPDGKRLAYGAESLGGNPVINGLYVFDVTTGTSRQIRPFTRKGGATGWNEIAWSPDGNRIAYTSTSILPALRTRIVVVDANGRHASTLDTGGARFPGWPSWSPDGRRIAYATAKRFSQGEFTARLDGSIYVMHSDGTHRSLIARHGTAPAWSPDGTRIAYLSGCGPPPLRATQPTGIRVVTPGGRDLTHQTTPTGCITLGVAGPPAWSPDGTKIATANRTGVYVMNADGSNLYRLAPIAPTSIASNNLSWSRPAWQPLP